MMIFKNFDGGPWLGESGTILTHQASIYGEACQLTPYQIYVVILTRWKRWRSGLVGLCSPGFCGSQYGFISSSIF